MVDGWQMPMHRFDQVIVDRSRNVVGKQRGIQRTGVAPHTRVVDIFQDGAIERGGQRVLVRRELDIVLLKRLASHSSLG